MSTDVPSPFDEDLVKRLLTERRAAWDELHAGLIWDSTIISPTIFSETDLEFLNKYLARGLKFKVCFEFKHSW